MKFHFMKKKTELLIFKYKQEKLDDLKIELW